MASGMSGGNFVSINRTKLELKQNIIGTWITIQFPINRTKLELKLSLCFYTNKIAPAINRTKLELKPRR